MENNWKYKSIVNLQKMRDFTPDANPRTRLVRRCEELLQISLNEYSIEDLRLMIGQEFGLDYLIPLAIEKLNEDIFAEGDFFPGDLLSNVLKINSGFWKQNPSLYQEVKCLISTRKDDIADEGIKMDIFMSALQ